MASVRILGLKKPRQLPLSRCLLFILITPPPSANDFLPFACIYWALLIHLQEKQRHSIAAILRPTVLARQVICLTMKSLRDVIVFEIRILAWRSKISSYKHSRIKAHSTLTPQMHTISFDVRPWIIVIRIEGRLFRWTCWNIVKLQRG